MKIAVFLQPTVETVSYVLYKRMSLIKKGQSTCSIIPAN